MIVTLSIFVSASYQSLGSSRSMVAEPEGLASPSYNLLVTIENSKKKSFIVAVDFDR